MILKKFQNNPTNKSETTKKSEIIKEIQGIPDKEIEQNPGRNPRESQGNPGVLKNNQRSPRDSGKKFAKEVQDNSNKISAKKSKRNLKESQIFSPKNASVIFIEKYDKLPRTSLEIRQLSQRKIRRTEIQDYPKQANIISNQESMNYLIFVLCPE